MRKVASGGDLDPHYGSSYGIYKSNDGGETWVEKNTGLEHSQMSINDIAIHPNNPDIVYIGTFHDGIYKTVNGTESWERMSNGLGFSDVRSLAIDMNMATTAIISAVKPMILLILGFFSLVRKAIQSLNDSM